MLAQGLVKDQFSVLFVLDRYGAPYAALLDAELDDKRYEYGSFEWLEDIGLKCPG